MKRGFTLIELLVVIAVISLLMSILMPALSRAREQAKIVVVNDELYGISIALESYSMDNGNKYPPTRADCNPSARKHSYALPQELVDEKYLPGGEIGKVRFARIEDKFNKGCAYKYIAVGPVYDYTPSQLANQQLYIPKDFLNFEKEDRIKAMYEDYDSFPKFGKEDSYDDPSKSPVTWVLFSIGPRYDKQSLEERNFLITKGFPVLKRFWYSPESRKGILTRMRLKKGQHIGSFEN
jgi:prepilin-type N-terminal cleavage/methylation domain-containing protein